MPTSSLAMGQLLRQVSHRGSIPTLPTLPPIPTTANGRAVLESKTRVARVVLLDCAPSARHTRLTELRGQPELSTLQMDCWAIYLRGHARALDLRVVDSTSLAIHAVANALAVHVVTPLFEPWNPPSQRDLRVRLPDKQSRCRMLSSGRLITGTSDDDWRLAAVLLGATSSTCPMSGRKRTDR